VWDSQTGQACAILGGRAGIIYHAVFFPNDQQILTASDDGTACVWNAENGGVYMVVTSHGENVLAAVSPDGKRIATASMNANTVRLWDAGTGRQFSVLKYQTGQAKSVAFSPDGQKVITACDDGSAHVWSLRRPEWEWGVIALPEFWLVLLTGISLAIIGIQSLRSRSRPRFVLSRIGPASSVQSLPKQLG
jgi:WD40 repeat protein